jgi:GTPase
MIDDETTGDEPPARSDPEVPASPPGFRSGFVALVGRPNVGKSTLLNQILGSKVTIVSDKPQTTRHEIRGVLTRDGAQVVFVDTPGVHKPRTKLGERLNVTAADARAGVDVVCLVVDGRSGFGRGDRFLAQELDPQRTVVVLNKVDGLDGERVMAQLQATGELDASAYFPVSARTGRGVPALVDHLVSRLPEGPQWYPAGMVTDVPDERWVAELVREQLLRVTREEVPHSVATRVVEWEWPRVRVEILVERESQKGIVIGKGGQVLKEVGTRARRQLPEGVFLDLFVTVDRDWQRRPQSLDRLGY